MPRGGWVKPETDQRLSDHISIGVLTRVFSPEVVDRVIAESGRTEQRQRLLPARVVVYYVLGLGLYGSSSYEEVMRMLVDGLSWQSGWRAPWSVPSKAALFKARARLGPEPLRALFEQVAKPLAERQTAGAFYRELRLVSVDGTCLDVADTKVNEQAFGRPGSGRGEHVAAFPQLRLVGLGECGTHALFSVAIGPLKDDERTLATRLLGALSSGMLCLADRGFYSFKLWNKARQSGAELLWRTKSSHRLAVKERLSDGSYRSELFASSDRKREAPVPVRVIEYEIEDPGRPAGEASYRLLTTILNPERAPAAELAALYAERWEFESALDELKVHQRGPRVVLRSKTPDGVIQEVYGHLCVHYAIRWLMHTIALEQGHDPDRISFTRTLRVARRTTASHSGFSPRSTHLSP
ncbi:MAG: IS4 family transposase [Actinobacteria bacterium]|nr:IS4 family transposase [Actinomycetota bacterium]MCA1698870.1 IS4 family transposase [Actinomycetota bacterium]